MQMIRRVLAGAVVVAARFLLVGSVALTGTVASSRVEAVSTQQAGPQLVGVNIRPLHLSSSYSQYSAAELIRRVTDVGGSVVRISVHWAWVEPVRQDDWDWTLVSRLDEVLDEASRRGVHVLATVLDTPCWASSKVDRDCSSPTGREATVRAAHPPSDPDHFAHFLRRLVAHAGGRVQHWEIWNEPNDSRFWNTREPAAEYGRLLRVAYRAVKDTRPEATVIGGAVTSGGQVDPLAFLGAVYDSGGLTSLDALSYHPYTDGALPSQFAEGSRTSLAWSVPALFDQLRARGAGHIPVWITESGASSQASGGEVGQATYVADAMRLIRQWQYVRGYLWYELLDDAPGSAEAGFGLFRHDLTLKPAAAAFANPSSFTAVPPAGLASCPPARDIELYHPTSADFRVAGPAIVHAWWSNERPSFKLETVKVLIPNGQVKFLRALGHVWLYQDTPACHEELPRQFANGSMAEMKIEDLRREGLVEVIAPIGPVIATPTPAPAPRQESGCPPARESRYPGGTGFAVNGPAIVHAWWNNDRPTFGGSEVRVRVDTGNVTFIAAGGSTWQYENTEACRRDLSSEFDKGDATHKQQKSVEDLRREGLVR